MSRILYKFVPKFWNLETYLLLLEPALLSHVILKLVKNPTKKGPETLKRAQGDRKEESRNLNLNKSDIKGLCQ